MKRNKALIIFCFQLIIVQFTSAFNDKQLLKIKDSFETRRNEAFEELRGKPLVVAKKEPPLESGRALFTRKFSYSLIDFAFKSFWLNEQIQVANRALDENSDYYTDNLLAMKDRDSFYWSTDELTRIIEFFGSKGTRTPNLVSKETEARIYKMMWQYAKVFSKISDSEYKKSETWFIEESENHHIQGFSTYWHFSKLLKDNPEYKNLKYDDGFSASEHYNAWNDYCKQWLIERAKKGLFVEMANENYGLSTLKGIYNFYDFGDAKLSRLSGMLLDLYWATWAEEQIDGVRGGSKSRVYPGVNSKSGQGNLWKMAWYYFKLTEPSLLRGNFFTLVSSRYTPPLVVMDLALDTEGRGEYEIKQRGLGLATNSYYSPPDYRLKTDSGGIVRYSYCSPGFIMGTAHFDALPFTSWTMISSQNRWQGIIFSGNPYARIFPQCSDDKTYRSYNQHLSVQNKGCLITQKLPNKTYSKDGRPMRVYFSKQGLSNMVEKDGWVFVTSQDAYTAVKCVSKGYKWIEEAGGKWLMCDDEYTPVIFEVCRKKEFSTYNQFQEKILTLPISFDGKMLSYTSIYNDNFNFYADLSKLATVNGKTLNLAPKLVFDSPFIKSIFNSGVVEITKENRKLTLNFTK